MFFFIKKKTSLSHSAVEVIVICGLKVFFYCEKIVSKMTTPSIVICYEIFSTYFFSGTIFPYLKKKRLLR